jgi:hypothetical protein
VADQHFAQIGDGGAAVVDVVDDQDAAALAALGGELFEQLVGEGGVRRSCDRPIAW